MADYVAVAPLDQLPPGASRWPSSTWREPCTRWTMPVAMPVRPWGQESCVARSCAVLPTAGDTTSARGRRSMDRGQGHVLPGAGRGRDHPGRARLEVWHRLGGETALHQPSSRHGAGVARAIPGHAASRCGWTLGWWRSGASAKSSAVSKMGGTLSPRGRRHTHDDCQCCACDREVHRLSMDVLSCYVSIGENDEQNLQLVLSIRVCR